MADHAELLKSMLQDIIHDRHDNASQTMHDYFVSKTREVSGMGQPAPAEAVTDVGNDDDDENQDE